MILEELNGLIRQGEQELQRIREKLRKLYKDIEELGEVKRIMGEMLEKHQAVTNRQRNAMNADFLNNNRSMQMFRQGMLGMLDGSGRQTENLRDAAGTVDDCMRDKNASIGQSERDIDQLNAQLSAYSAEADALAASAGE